MISSVVFGGFKQGDWKIHFPPRSQVPLAKRSSNCHDSMWNRWEEKSLVMLGNDRIPGFGIPTVSGHLSTKLSQEP